MLSKYELLYKLIGASFGEWGLWPTKLVALKPLQFNLFMTCAIPVNETILRDRITDMNFNQLAKDINERFAYCAKYVGISVPPDGMSGAGNEDLVRTGWTRPANPAWSRMKDTRLRNRMKKGTRYGPDEEYPVWTGWGVPGYGMEPDDEDPGYEAGWRKYPERSTHRMREHICKYVSKGR
mgnify:CR=1 FL=1